MPRYAMSFDLLKNRLSIEEVASTIVPHPPKAAPQGRCVCIADYGHSGAAAIAAEAMQKGIYFGFNGSQHLKLPIDLDLGSVAYRAHREGLKASGDVLPAWDVLPEHLQRLWREVAVAILRSAFHEETSNG